MSGCDQYQAQFEEFAKTAKASDEFLAHLDKCKQCQKGVEELAKKAEAGLTAVAALLEEERRKKGSL